MRGGYYHGHVAVVRRVTALPRARRMLLLMALLVGIVAMHALTIAPGNDSTHNTTTTVAHHSSDGHNNSADEPCQSNCCQHQSGLHECVFIMTVTSIASGPTLWCWVGIAVATLLAPLLLHLCRRRQRAPPWTVRSLFELSILRI
jgi:hypothetical protein